MTTCAPAVARRDGDVVTWSPRFVQLRGHYAFHATACTPATPREKGSVEGAVRYYQSGFWPARRFSSLAELDDVYVDWRDRVALPRRHATGGHVVAERLQHEREHVRALPPARFDAAGRRSSRVPLDGYLKHGASFYARRKRWCISAWSCVGTAITSGSSTAATRSPPTRAATPPPRSSRRPGCAPSPRPRRR